MIHLDLALWSFLLALGGALTATPIARRYAVRMNILDHPDPSRPYKLHANPVPYLGGFALVAVVAVTSGSAGVWREATVVGIATVLLFVVGLVDDLESMRLPGKLAVQTLAAILAIFAGVRASVTGVELIDAMITLVWLIGITNAINIIDNCNGICSGTLFVSAAAFTIIAVAHDQSLITVLAASIAGAALGFLPFNFPKARLFMGDSGTLPLGYLIGVVALELEPGLPPPWSFAVPLCVLALPVANTWIVVVHRLSQRRPFYVGASDSLWHRLVGQGLSESVAVIVLLTGQAIFATVAVLAATGSIPTAIPTMALVLVFGGSLLFLRRPRRLVASDARQRNAVAR
jgi:UDP-GlcNAc:undecaprenyl-phosphate/decaprenyl-phosphate GlcNAc-1-phosphate transferase